jgi:hypothetical protein
MCYDFHDLHTTSHVTVCLKNMTYPSTPPRKGPIPNVNIWSAVLATLKVGLDRFFALNELVSFWIDLSIQIQESIVRIIRQFCAMKKITVLFTESHHYTYPEFGSLYI